MSLAVCAMSGVWLLVSRVPLPVKKFSRFGIISRSLGTFGLSREKWTLSNISLTTCLTPLPSWQPAGPPPAWCAGTAGAALAAPAPATPAPASSAADAAIVAIPLDLGRRLPLGPADLNTHPPSPEPRIIPTQLH